MVSLPWNKSIIQGVTSLFQSVAGKLLLSFPGITIPVLPKAPKSHNTWASPFPGLQAPFRHLKNLGMWRVWEFRRWILNSWITFLWCEPNSGHKPNGKRAEAPLFIIIYLSSPLLELGEKNSLFVQLKMQIGEAKPAGEASARGHGVEINSWNFLLHKSQDLILTTRSSGVVQAKQTSRCHFSG